MRDVKGRFVKGGVGFWTGKKRSTFSTTWREKIGKGHKGLAYKISKDRGKYRIGSKHTEEAKRKMSATRIARKRGVGVSNGSWKGGVSKDKEYRRKQRREWRHKVGKSKRYRHEIIAVPKKVYGQRYKALKKAGGELPIARIQMVYEDNIKKYGTLTCYLCENPILFGKDNLEHKAPLSRGGTNEYKNLGVACFKCNRKKGKKTVEEYKEEVF